MVVFSTQMTFAGNIFLHGYNKQKMADLMMQSNENNNGP
jgi:hypothetical protein